MTAPNAIPPLKPRPRVARGPRRPDYLGSRDLDRLMMMLTALVGEVSVLRERIDTHERLADVGLAPTTAAVEAFTLDAGDTARRAAMRDALLARVYRVMFDELELAARPDEETP